VPLTAARHVEVDAIDPITVPRVTRRVARTPSIVNRSRLLGFGGTLVLHGLAVSLLIPATVTHEKNPLDLGGVTAPQARSTPEDELVLVNIKGPEKRDSESGTIHVDLRAQLARLATLPIIPDQTPVIDLPDADADAENSAQSDASSGDAELRARMFGRYTGQISARIERAWEKPESPANDTRTSRAGDADDADRFVCQVEIRQDNRGNVQEVLLLACNGTEAWRHSLVVAINQSSPLPAPPIPTVFKRAITMTFEWRVDPQGPLPEGAAVDPRGASR
jgi:hypothetical protein